MALHTKTSTCTSIRGTLGIRRKRSKEENGDTIRLQRIGEDSKGHTTSRRHLVAILRAHTNKQYRYHIRAVGARLDSEGGDKRGARCYFYSSEASLFTHWIAIYTFFSVANVYR